MLIPQVYIVHNPETNFVFSIFSASLSGTVGHGNIVGVYAINIITFRNIFICFNNLFYMCMNRDCVFFVEVINKHDCVYSCFNEIKEL